MRSDTAIIYMLQGAELYGRVFQSVNKMYGGGGGGGAGRWRGCKPTVAVLTRLPSAGPV